MEAGIVTATDGSSTGPASPPPDPPTPRSSSMRSPRSSPRSSSGPRSSRLRVGSAAVARWVRWPDRQSTEHPRLAPVPAARPPRRLVGVPVAVDNDAKALAVGEGWVGAARGCDDYLAMVVSTGIGGGLVLDGRLLDGSGATPATSGTSWSSLRPSLRMWRPGLPGGGGVGHRDRSGDRTSGRRGVSGRAPPMWNPRGTGRGIGGLPLGPPARRGGRFGRPGVRGRVLRRRHRGAEAPVWPRLRPAYPYRAGWPRRRRPLIGAAAVASSGRTEQRPGVPTTRVTSRTRECRSCRVPT